MASYWKSNPRYFCEICKCWLADNKASIEFHERGKSHRDKKEKHLAQLRKSSAEQYKNQQQAGVYLRQMENAALEAYKKDLAAQGLVIDGEMPHLASSRPNSGIHEMHHQEAPRGKKKIKIHNAADVRESKIIKNSAWVKQFSPEGTEYYWNTETGKSQWQKPDNFTETKKEPDKDTTKPSTSQKSSKRSPWQEHVSPEGQTYYWNSDTGKTQWDKPDDLDADGSKQQQEQGKPRNISQNDSSKCPWTEEVSPEGHSYYWNSETGKSQWEKPEDYIEPKINFIPVETKVKDDEQTCEVNRKKPRHNPYGTWSVVQEKRQKKMVDWQLPAKMENSAAEGLVDRNSLEQLPEPEAPKFDEKVVISLGGSEGPTAFKKKMSKQRSIRKRNSDD